MIFEGDENFVRWKMMKK